MKEEYVTRKEFDKAVRDLRKQISEQNQLIDDLYICMADTVEKQKREYLAENKRNIDVLIEDVQHRIDVMNEYR